ncbi:MAG: hypothetical protein M3453_17280 [Pseudomonadota bacterium]|nr:hypothetical protein [Pseudomonadota bacterium]
MAAMGLRRTLAVINAMEAERLIGRYAIAGAVAAYNYIEAAVTEDVDILVSFDSPGLVTGSPGLITLEPIYSFLRKRGYTEHRKEGVLIEGWPVQFLPVASDLERDALAEAETVELEIPGESSATTRVLRPEHLVAIALKVGRPKDVLRVVQFVESAAIGADLLRPVLQRHGLEPAWRAFCRRTGVPDILHRGAPS